MTSYSTKYFPFCPRVPWRIKNGIYVLPELSGVSWKKANQDKKPLVVCESGFIESILSLCFLEMYNFLAPSIPVKWSGPERFYPLLAMNMLAKPGEKIDPLLFRKFPTPLFMDRQDNLYVNVTYNYLKMSPYYGGKEKRRHEPIFQQLLENTTQPWRDSFLPMFRNVGDTLSEIERWERRLKFSTKIPFVCIIPDKEISIHKPSCLKWSDMEVRSLAAMLKQIGINTLVVTNRNAKYYNSHAICVPFRTDTTLCLINKAKMVLAEDVDWLLLSGMISNAKIGSVEIDKRLDIAANMRVIGRTADICKSKKLRPVDVFNFLEPTCRTPL